MMESINPQKKKEIIQEKEKGREAASGGNSPKSPAPEQLELPEVGFSKENREKINTRIWVVGGEDDPLFEMMKNQGYQVKIFPDGTSLQEEITEKGLNCDLIVSDFPYEIEFFIEDIHEMDGFSDFPIIVLGEDIDTQEEKDHFTSMGALYVEKQENNEALLFVMGELIEDFKKNKK